MASKGVHSKDKELEKSKNNNFTWKIVSTKNYHEDHVNRGTREIYEINWKWNNFSRLKIVFT